MNDAFIPSLRKHLETWEREASAQWQAVIRSPRVLRRIGNQINRTLETQQRINAALQQSAPDGIANYDDITRVLYLLERIEHELDALATRIDRIESKLAR